MEYAVAHGYLRARSKGYSGRRDREIARHRPRTSRRSQMGEFVADMARLGLVSSGASPDGPLSGAG